MTRAVAIVMAAFMVLGARNTSAASSAVATTKPRTKPAAPPVQSVRGDHVNIEGKLYSPQALFILTRREETFGRQAIVPQYLERPKDSAFLPYRLRAEVLDRSARSARH